MWRVGVASQWRPKYTAWRLASGYARAAGRQLGGGCHLKRGGWLANTSQRGGGDNINAVEGRAYTTSKGVTSLVMTVTARRGRRRGVNVGLVAAGNDIALPACAVTAAAARALHRPM